MKDRRRHLPTKKMTIVLTDHRLSDNVDLIRRINYSIS